MIMTIHNTEGIHVGGLAQKLGITKGSVSEMLRKLERKGLVRKEKDPLKMTRLNVYLTDKGKTAHENHMYYHSRLDGVVAEATGLQQKLTAPCPQAHCLRLHRKARRLQRSPAYRPGPDNAQPPA